VKPAVSIGRYASGVLVAVVLAGCATTLPRYKPVLSEVDIPTDHQAGIQMLVSLVAVRADEKSGMPAGIEARIRLENHTEAPARIEPDGLELVDTNLESFPAPRVSPPDGLDVKPGGRAVLSALFPYPPDEAGDSDALASLNLRWRVENGGKSYGHGLTFHRREPKVVEYDYAGPYYWGPGWGWGWDGGWWGPPVIVREHDIGHGGDHDRR
jgi:hypothetical protein